MASEWQLREVNELIADGILLIGDGYRAKNSELAATGLPFARAGNINDGFRFDDADRFPETGLDRVGNKVSQPGDVVFTSKGTVGRFAFVRPSTPRFVYSPQLCFWRSLDHEKIYPRFLYYWMFGREFFVQFKGVAGQTDMAEYVSLTDQRRMHVTLPGLEEQRAIAHILGTLDNKIELNRRMNETLEAMARALFKSWFVDFLPVRANMAAKVRDRLLDLPEAEPGQWFVYALECEDGSTYIGQTEDLRQRWQQHLGGKGGDWTRAHPPQRIAYWERLRLRTEAVEREKWLKTGFGRKWLKKEIAAARTQTGDPVRAKAEGRDPGLPKSIADLFPDSFEDSELGEVPKGWRVRRWGDLVTLEYGKSLTGYASSEGVYPVFGTNGRIGSHSEPLCTHPGIVIGRKGAYRGIHYCSSPFFVIDTAFYVEPKVDLDLRWAYYELSRQDINDMDSGSAIPSTSREDFYGLPVVEAPRAAQTRFVESLEPLWGRQEQNDRESRLLAALRDTLLPKLISGELRVTDAAQGVEATA
jgi:restriction endonuclease S subunit/predicted GIY-YIG superfamily endonuclease